jgi:hypothetical protein
VVVGPVRFRYCDNECRENDKLEFSIVRETAGPRSRLLPTTTLPDTSYPSISTIETKSSMPRVES